MPCPAAVPSHRNGLSLLFFLLASGLLAGCGGGGQAATVTPDATQASSPTLTLSLPARGLQPQQLALLVAQGDALSQAIAAEYQAKRGVPAANIIRLAVDVGSDTLSAADFVALKAQLDARLPAGVQATLVTWSAPSRVVGSCTMSLTSALALGFDAKYCASGCAATAASGYFDSESTQVWSDHNLRPSMMLGARTLAGAQALIARGISADASYPSGDGYLVRTSDAARSVRFADYVALPGQWAGPEGLQLFYVDNSAGTGSDAINGKSKLLFYFTGLAQVPGAASNSFRPGAIADHLTSFGGYLPSGNGQMPITAWLDAGATASYGTVAEPCNFTQKFPRASVLLDHYYRGDSLIEAYWKSVQWPGQGLFVGEPLARPFADTPTLSVLAGQYRISTRGLRAAATYSLQYRNADSSSWITLASFSPARAQPAVFTAPLPPASAVQLRWTGPCPALPSLQCALGSSSAP